MENDALASNEIAAEDNGEDLVSKLISSETPPHVEPAFVPLITDDLEIERAEEAISTSTAQVTEDTINEHILSTIQASEALAPLVVPDIDLLSPVVNNDVNDQAFRDLGNAMGMEAELISRLECEINSWRRIVVAAATKLGLAEETIPERLNGKEGAAVSIEEAICNAIDKMTDNGTITNAASSQSANNNNNTDACAAQPTWEELVEEPCPPPEYGLDSPMITHLLSTWTADHTKVGRSLRFLLERGFYP
jgi:hypothetical protein